MYSIAVVAIAKLANCSQPMCTRTATASYIFLRTCVRTATASFFFQVPCARTATASCFFQVACARTATAIIQAFQLKSYKNKKLWKV